MHTLKEKASNAAAEAKERVEVTKDKAEEKAAKTVARTKEEENIAEERKKAMEHEAQMRLHETKAENATRRLQEKHHHHDPLVGGRKIL